MCAEIQARCVNIIAELFNAPRTNNKCDGVGVSTIGSSEAIILATLAMKRKWQLKGREQGKSTDKPNLIMGANVQVCWEKAVNYLVRQFFFHFISFLSPFSLIRPLKC